MLHHKGQVEVISSLEKDGTPIPYDIRFGVFVVFEGETEYIRRCFSEYGVKTDPSGRYACLYKRWHLIGLEVGISVASRRPARRAYRLRDRLARRCRRDCKDAISKPEKCSTARAATPWSGSSMPAQASLAQACLPLGLAHGWKVLRPVAAGQPVRWSDVAFDANSTAVRVRREMEASIRADAGRLDQAAPALDLLADELR